MTSETDRLDAIRERLREFTRERDWAQFHNPKNLAMAVASEAGELLSLLRWTDGGQSDEYVKQSTVRQKVAQEVADVAITLLLFCDRAGIDLLTAIDDKIEMNAARYPADQSRGQSERPSL